MAIDGQKSGILMDSGSFEFLQGYTDTLRAERFEQPGPCHQVDSGPELPEDVGEFSAHDSSPDDHHLPGKGGHG
jgi:hypothetical protein